MKHSYKKHVGEIEELKDANQKLHEQVKELTSKNNILQEDYNKLKEKIETLMNSKTSKKNTKIIQGEKSEIFPGVKIYKSQGLSVVLI